MAPCILGQGKKMIEPILHFNRRNFDQLIKSAHALKVSDVIIRSNSNVQIKRFNQLIKVEGPPINRHELLNVLQEIYQNSIITSLGRGNTAKFRYPVMLEDDSKIFCRCEISAISSSEDDCGAEITLRLLNEIIPEAEDIDMPMQVIDRIKNDFGIMLFSGPTGSGKSTSVASSLQHHIRHHHDNIITFEDPIEFDFSQVTNRIVDVAQSEIPKHITSFDKAFKGSLRRAPDKMFWSEIRGKDAISNLVTSALTGHYVISTVHTSTVEQTLTRLIDSYPTEEQRAASVRIFEAIDTIVNQKLLANVENTGRTAVRSYALFDAACKETLLDSLNYPERFSNIVREQVKTTGLAFLEDLETKFIEGRIGINPYVEHVKLHGGKVDAKLVNDVGSRLVECDELSEIDFFNQWKCHG